MIISHSLINLFIYDITGNKKIKLSGPRRDQFRYFLKLLLENETVNEQNKRSYHWWERILAQLKN